MDRVPSSGLTWWPASQLSIVVMKKLFFAFNDLCRFTVNKRDSMRESNSRVLIRDIVI